jgi:hypothetical protein
MKMTQYSSIDTLLNQIVMVCKTVGSIDAHRGGGEGGGGHLMYPLKRFLKHFHIKMQ